MNRIFAIDLQNYAHVENVANLANMLSEFKCAGRVVVFANDASKIQATSTFEVVQLDGATTRSQFKNAINEFFKKDGFTGFLHVLEDNVALKKDPTTYLNELEHTMDVLDYDVYFSTTSDGCNYVYKKFNPRVNILIDSPLFSGLGLPSSLSFTSHSNTAWVSYNFAKVSDDLLKFNGQFDVAMYYIIEFLARRRNTKRSDQLYLMNQYLSIPSEVGVFSVVQSGQSVGDDQAKMASEDAYFKQMNLNFVPDNNIDQLLEDVINKLKSKI